MFAKDAVGREQGRCALRQHRVPCPATQPMATGDAKDEGQTSVVLGILHKPGLFPVAVLVRLWQCLVGQLSATQTLCQSYPELSWGQGCRGSQAEGEARDRGCLQLLPLVLAVQ